ncbi:MAG: hypothetical protein CSA64_03000 [Arachnia propionica]|nr:MAG: hypothetical protein CSA64_03000 [Arachnia propionica]
MSRSVAPWAESKPPRRRITLFGDLWAFAGSGFGLLRRRPADVPREGRIVRWRLNRSDIPAAPDMASLLAWRVELHTNGPAALQGLSLPAIFVLSETGSLDWQLLRLVLPKRLRTTSHRHDRALQAGRSVAVLQARDDAKSYAAAAVELANVYGAPVVPVVVLGGFKLRELQRLSLRTRPRVSVRFGAAIHPRGKSAAEMLDEVHSSLTELRSRGELSWWATLQGQAETPVVQSLPRWQRLWEQSAPGPAQAKQRVWRD